LINHAVGKPADFAAEKLAENLKKLLKNQRKFGKIWKSSEGEKLVFSPDFPSFLPLDLLDCRSGGCGFESRRAR
jgi:hypothetical protein